MVAELVELEWMFSRLYMSEGSTSHAALLPVLHDDDGPENNGFAL